MRTCDNCGEDISHKKASAKACSVECNHALLAARRKAEKWEGVDPDRRCEGCGEPMTGKRPHAKFCSKSCKARAGQIRQRDAGVLRERDRARYPKEAEKRRAYARQYLKDNPERMRAIRRRRKGQLRAPGAHFTERDWTRLLHQYRHACAYCGATGTLVREHVIPLKRGGRHTVGNIVPACPSCNARKGTRLLAAFRYERG